MLCLEIKCLVLVQHQLCHTHRIIFQSLGVHIKMYNLTTTTSFKNRLLKSSFRFMTKLKKINNFLYTPLTPHISTSSCQYQHPTPERYTYYNPWTYTRVRSWWCVFSEFWQAYNDLYSTRVLYRIGNGNPLQYSCLGNSKDRGAWHVIVRGVAKNRTWLTECAHTHRIVSLP